jgi:hypothetical protein
MDERYLHRVSVHDSALRLRCRAWLITDAVQIGHPRLALLRQLEPEKKKSRGLAAPGPESSCYCRARRTARRLGQVRTTLDKIVHGLGLFAHGRRKGLAAQLVSFGGSATASTTPAIRCSPPASQRAPRHSELPGLSSNGQNMPSLFCTRSRGTSLAQGAFFDENRPRRKLASHRPSLTRLASVQSRTALCISHALPPPSVFSQQRVTGAADGASASAATLPMMLRCHGCTAQPSGLPRGPPRHD